MEWFSYEEEEEKTTRKPKIEPIPQTMKLVFDFQPIIERLGISQREISNGTGIRFGTVNDYINGTFKTISPDNIAHMIEYLNRNYGVEWTEIVKFEPMTEEEIQQKIEEKLKRKRKAPSGMYAKYGQYMTKEMLTEQQNEKEDEQATE